jgi:hypothetical protein
VWINYEVLIQELVYAAFGHLGTRPPFAARRAKRLPFLNLREPLSASRQDLWLSLSMRRTFKRRRAPHNTRWLRGVRLKAAVGMPSWWLSVKNAAWLDGR